MVDIRERMRRIVIYKHIFMYIHPRMYICMCVSKNIMYKKGIHIYIYINAMTANGRKTIGGGGRRVQYVPI